MIGSIRCERPREQGLLLVASRQGKDVVVHVRRANGHSCLPRCGQRGFGLEVDQPKPAHGPERSDGRVLADGPEIEDAVRLAVAGDEGNAAGHLGTPSREDVEQHPRLSMAGKPGQADHFSAPDLKASGPDDHRLSRRVAPLGTYVFPRLRAHRRDQRVAGEVGCLALRNGPSVLHHHDAMGRGQDFAEEMRDQDDGGAALGLRFHIGQELLGGHGIERRGRLIQNDKAQRIGRQREGAGNLGHLALAD